MKALVGAFNQEKALVGAFSVIVQLHGLIVYNTDQEGAADVGVEVALYELHGPRPAHRHHRHVPQRAGHEPRVAAEQREKQSSLVSNEIVGY